MNSFSGKRSCFYLSNSSLILRISIWNLSNVLLAAIFCSTVQLCKQIVILSRDKGATISLLTLFKDKIWRVYHMKMFYGIPRDLQLSRFASAVGFLDPLFMRKLQAYVIESCYLSNQPSPQTNCYLYNYGQLGKG